MAKEILLVGNASNTEVWQEQLERQGFVCHAAATMVDAYDYLRDHDNTKLQLLVQQNLPITWPAPKLPEFPPEFNVTQYSRGEAFIRFARDKGFIASDTPTYLAADFPKEVETSSAVSKVVEIDPEKDMGHQLKPGQYRAPTGKRVRGTEE